MFSNFLTENRTVCEIATCDKIIQCMCFACCITKPTNTQSEYVILIAFPLRSGRRTRLSVRLYVHCLSCYTAAAWTEARTSYRVQWLGCGLDKAMFESRHMKNILPFSTRSKPTLSPA